MSVHHIHAWCLGKLEEGVNPLELELTVVTLYVRYWELNQVLFTADASLQLCPYTLKANLRKKLPVWEREDFSRTLRNFLNFSSLLRRKWYSLIKII